jgi:DNA-binding PucR family transcriptional regulator
VRDVPGLAGSHNPQLSALRISHPQRFIDTCVKAIVLNKGIVQNAAAALKIHRNTLMTWIRTYPELKRAVDQSR